MAGREWYHRYIDALCDNDLSLTDRDRALLEALGPRVRFFKQRTEAFEVDVAGRKGRELVIAEIAVIAGEQLKLVNRGDAAETNVVGTIGRLLMISGFRLGKGWSERLDRRLRSKATPDGQSWISAVGGPAKAGRELVAVSLNGELSAGTIERVLRESAPEDRQRLLNAALDPELVTADLQRIVDEERELFLHVSLHPNEDGELEGTAEFVTERQYRRGRTGERATNSYKKPNRAKGRGT